MSSESSLAASIWRRCCCSLPTSTRSASTSPEGLRFTETFYRDLNDGTRAFSERFAARMKNHAMPTMAQAGVYASLLHYFTALEALGGNP
jgi:hypothetical protein